MAFTDTDKILGTKGLMELVGRGALVVSVEDAEAVLDWLNHQETVLPFLDPTLYMKIGDNVPGHVDFVRAFIAFRKEIEKIMQEQR